MGKLIRSATVGIINFSWVERANAVQHRAGVGIVEDGPIRAGEAEGMAAAVLLSVRIGMVARRIGINARLVPALFRPTIGRMALATNISPLPMATVVSNRTCVPGRILVGPNGRIKSNGDRPFLACIVPRVSIPDGVLVNDVLESAMASIVLGGSVIPRWT